MLFYFFTDCACILSGMTKVKVGKEDPSSDYFVEKRRAALERWADSHDILCSSYKYSIGYSCNRDRTKYEHNFSVWTDNTPYLDMETDIICTPPVKQLDTPFNSKFFV